MNCRLSIVLLASLLPLIGGYTYHWGSCPQIRPVPDFSMEKFSGHWFVIYRIDTSSSCWTYDYVVTNNTMRVVQVRNQIVDVKDPEESKEYSGTLEVPNKTNSGFMTVRYPDNLAGKLEYTVFATDYDNYGAIFSCQKILFGHRETASILSRKPYLEQIYTYKARSILMEYGIELKDLHRIDHTGCKYAPPTMSVYNLTQWDY